MSGATDWADGYVAKNYNQRSVLGSYLDPLADKTLMCSVIAAMGYTVSGAGGWAGAGERGWAVLRGALVRRCEQRYRRARRLAGWQVGCLRA